MEAQATEHQGLARGPNTPWSMILKGTHPGTVNLLGLQPSFLQTHLPLQGLSVRHRPEHLGFPGMRGVVTYAHDLIFQKKFLAQV